jgi:competence protein ComEC
MPWPAPWWWPWSGGPAAGWGAAWPPWSTITPSQIREWVAQETAGGRLLPWFAVTYGAGIVVYFSAEREPSLWAAVALTAFCGIAAVSLRKRFAGHVIALGVFAASLGFAVATLKTSLIDHPVLRFSASGVTIAGFVGRDHRRFCRTSRGKPADRFVLRVDRIEGGRMDVKPERVRLSVKRGMAPVPGSYVEVKALLDPPLQPLEPGSYDFARDLFFQGIGASGFARGSSGSPSRRCLRA